jgi:hypothetical protein
MLIHNSLSLESNKAVTQKCSHGSRTKKISSEKESIKKQNTKAAGFDVYKMPTKIDFAN